MELKSAQCTVVQIFGKFTEEPQLKNCVIFAVLTGNMFQLLLGNIIYVAALIEILEQM